MAAKVSELRQTLAGRYFYTYSLNLLCVTGLLFLASFARISLELM